MTVAFLTTVGHSLWTVPAGVTSVKVECIGGGGSGQNASPAGGGGGRRAAAGAQGLIVLTYTAAAGFPYSFGTLVGF